MQIFNFLNLDDFKSTLKVSKFIKDSTLKYLTTSIKYCRFSDFLRYNSTSELISFLKLLKNLECLKIITINF